MASPTERTYEVTALFRAPLAFAYRWCTDYSSKDPSLERSKSYRRILERTRDRVVYEDLEKTTDGWFWSRSTVQLQPPNRWHAEMVGNYRSWKLDYWLVELGPDRTEFHLRGRRRPMLLGRKNPSRAELEGELTVTWKNFAKALEADYSRSVARRRRGR